MPEWIMPVLTTAAIGLLVWILLVIIGLKEKMIEAHMRLGRIESDMESEKGTRKRLHENFDRRLLELERHPR